MPRPDDFVLKRGPPVSRRTAALLLGSCLLGASRVRAATMPLSDEIVARSQLASGDLTRLAGVFAKARRGEPITLGVIGGSITAGAFASTPQNSYAGRLLGWWRQQFPACEISLVNAGVGGTGSMYGAVRAGNDLLARRPDFVVVEFAVNDNWTDGEAFEGLVRQILAQPNEPALLLLFMMWERGGNDQAMQARVGAHYGLPMVSFRDAIWPEIEAGRLQWSDYIVDTVHPTDRGHAAIARFVAAMCDNALRTASTGNPSAVGSLPSPLHSDAFQHVEWREAAALDPVANQGWRLLAGEKTVATWHCVEPGGRIAFDWFGTGLVAVFADSESMDLRRVRFCIDGGSWQTLDALKQPKRIVMVLARDRTPERHSVAFERVDNDDGSSPLRLLGLAGIGTRQDQN
jgi:lysophospholipase L1-like esterase